MKQDTLTFIPSDFNDLNNPMVMPDDNEGAEEMKKYYEGISQFQDINDCPFARAWKRAGLPEQRSYPDLKYKCDWIDKIRVELLNGAQSVTVNL